MPQNGALFRSQTGHAPNIGNDAKDGKVNFL
jgi:hypothetical protein